MLTRDASQKKTAKIQTLNKIKEIFIFLNLQIKKIKFY